jgi:hypothetical protein
MTASLCFVHSFTRSSGVRPNILKKHSDLDSLANSVMILDHRYSYQLRQSRRDIDILYHLIREAIEDAKFELKYIPTGRTWPRHLPRASSIALRDYWYFARLQVQR